MTSNSLQRVRNLLNEMLDTQWALDSRVRPDFDPPFGICIWDFVPADATLLGSIDPARLQAGLFAVELRDIDLLLAVMGGTDLSLMLKPVTPATLRALVGEGCRKVQRNATDAGSTALQDTDCLGSMAETILRLQKGVQAKGWLLSQCFYELSAPCIAITGYCEPYEEEWLGELTSDAREVAKRREDSAKRVSRLLETMREVTSGEAGTERQQIELMEPRDCVEAAQCRVAPFPEGKSIDVRVDIRPPSRPGCIQSLARRKVDGGPVRECLQVVAAWSVAGDIGLSVFWEAGVPRRRRSDQSPGGTHTAIRGEPHIGSTFVILALRVPRHSANYSRIHTRSGNEDSVDRWCGDGYLQNHRGGTARLRVARGRTAKFTHLCGVAFT